MKEGFFIVTISKQEALYLNTHGVPYGENGIKSSTSRHSGKSYWVCTSSRNMKLLREYRNKPSKK